MPNQLADARADRYMVPALVVLPDHEHFQARHTVFERPPGHLLVNKTSEVFVAVLDFGGLAAQHEISVDRCHGLAAQNEISVDRCHGLAAQNENSVDRCLENFCRKLL